MNDAVEPGTKVRHTRHGKGRVVDQPPRINQAHLVPVWFEGEDDYRWVSRHNCEVQP